MQNKNFSIIFVLLIFYFFYKKFSKSTTVDYSKISKSDFVDLLKEKTKVSLDFGIPQNFLIAQIIQESEWGKSTLFSKYNNVGGIKCHGSNNCVTLRNNSNDNEYSSSYRIYDSLEDGIYELCKFLKDNPRYILAFNYPNDSLRFAEQVSIAGYANSNYYNQLKPIIQKLQRNEY